MSFWNAIQDALERMKYGDECRPSPMLARWPVQPLPGTGEVSKPGGITSVAAWSGSSMLRKPEENAKAAAAMRLDRVDLMVADHSAWRGSYRFSDRPEKGRRAASLPDLKRVGRALSARGVGLGLTTWVMPHERYLEGLAGYLFDAVSELSGICPVTTVILDAEEPWTRATNRMRWRDAGKRLGDLLQPLKSAPFNVRIGLTGIGYAREEALDPLAEWCDFAVPQVYSTTRNNLDPVQSPKHFARRWTEKFELGTVSIGLAAYRQGPGMMEAALEGAREVAADPNSSKCNEVIYWSLQHLRSSAAKAKIVTGIKA